MSTFNARVTSASLNAATGVITTNIELRALESDPEPVRSFTFRFKSSDALAEVRSDAKARAIEEWLVYEATLARTAAATTLTSSLVGLSFNLST